MVAATRRTGGAGHSDDGAMRPEIERIATLGRTRVVVIGGGINGIATFRDLALQGVDVVLVERDDIAGGATAASSHMIHGGIRYLENGEFRLVRESVRERNDLLRTAAHVVRPLETTIPIYSTFSGLLSAPLKFLFGRSGRPAERGALLIKIGLVLYDLYSRGGRVVPRHRFAGRRRTRRELPELDPAVRYSATYFDAGVADPERLAVDVLLDGLRAHPGAHVGTRLAAVGMGPAGVRVRDGQTGREFDIAADVVVNATGPWADLTNGALGTPTHLLGGTKGSHIVLDHPELLAATGGREIFFEHSDGRIVLVYPLKGRVLVGTTDIEADPREPAACTEDEVDYFIDLVGRVFPRIVVDRSQIVYRYSGIRPLPRHDGQNAGAVSRDYRVETTAIADGPLLLSLIGGKWTTFRALGESLADRVLTVLGADRVTSTHGRPIGGAVDYPRDAAAREAWVARELGDLPAGRAAVLFARYGTRASEVAERIRAAAPDAPVLDDQLSAEEIAYLVDVEHVVHLDDLVFRRTDLAFTGRATRDALEQIGPHLARAAGWDDLRLDREIEACTDLLRRHGVAPGEEVRPAP